MRKLKEKAKRDRQIYELYSKGGFTYKEIGVKLGLSPHRVAVIYKRERGKLEFRGELLY